MEVKKKCRIDEKQLKTVRKFAKRISDTPETYQLFNYKAVIEGGVATISMGVKKSGDVPKAEKKLDSLFERIGLECC